MTAASLRPASIFLATAAILIAIIGTWSPSPLLATLWCLPSALLLMGLAYESRLVMRARVALQLAAAPRWYLGRSGAMRFDFRHALNRPLLLEIAPTAPADFAWDGAIRRLSVPASAPATLELRCTPRRLGVHSWPPLRVRVGGSLGLAWWPLELSAPCDVPVGPDAIRERSRVSGAGALGARSGRQLGAGGELLQLRPYRAGDSPRVIDWKATARAQRLISRDCSEDQHLEIMILIDAGRTSGLRAGDLDRFGHYVNAAARLAEYATSLDDRVGLILYADRPLLELAPARGIPAVVRIRRSLAAAQVQAAESNPLHAALRVRSLARHRSLVVLFTDLDDAAAAGQLAGAVRLLLPKHLPFVAGLSSAAAEALAQAPARRWLDPYRSLAAQEYCSGLQRKVQSLRALGAPALVAEPHLLERAMFDAYVTFRRQRRV